MKFKTRLKPSLSLIDLTPLVDVIFLLLIFFIVTSNILPLKSLNIENPTLPQNSLPLMTQILVVIDAQNVIYVGSKKAIVDLEGLGEAVGGEMKKLRAEGGTDSPTLVLSVDRRVTYDTFLKLFSKMLELGHPLRLSYKNEDATL